MTKSIGNAMICKRLLNFSMKSTKKLPLWLTYTSSIAIKGKSVRFEYKGGFEELDFAEVHSIMFYGSVCDLSQDFLE